MFQLDDNLLRELGLGDLPPAEKNKMLAHIYETLELRVGMKLAEQMTDAQLDEFEAFIDKNDEAGALKWLETNFPDYKQVVADELEKLKVEIKRDSPRIMEAMQANPVATTPQAWSPPTPAAPVSNSDPQQSGIPPTPPPTFPSGPAGPTPPPSPTT